MASNEITTASAPASGAGISSLLSGPGASRVIVMAIRVASMAINFIVQIVMARVMGLAAFGSANTALAILNIVVIPAALGYDTAAIRYVALAKDDQAKLRVITSYVGHAVAISCAVTAFLVGAAAAAEDALGSSELAIGLAFLVVIVPAFAFVRVGEAWLRGFGSVVRAQINSNLIVPLLSIVFLLAQRIALGSGHPIDVAGALGARAVATAISAALIVAFVARRLHGKSQAAPALEDSEKQDMQGVARVLCGVGFLTIVVSQLDIVAVSYLDGASAAGVYSAASRVSLAMNVCIVAVAFVLAPQVAKLFAERKMQQMQREVSVATFWSAALMTCACAILIPASPLVLRIFGSDFSGGANALRILMLGQLANGLCGPVAVVLNMTGRQTRAIRALAYAAVVDVIMLAVLIPQFGLTGAACSTAMCTLIWNVTMLVYVRRDLGIWVLPHFLATHLPQSLAAHTDEHAD